MKPEGIKRVDAVFNARYAGATNAKKTIMVDAGSKFTPISVSPEDAEVLAVRQTILWRRDRPTVCACRPPIVGDYTPRHVLTNSAQAGLWFAQHTLTPWARKIEAEFARVLFADSSTHVEIDLSGFVRGDFRCPVDC